MVSSDRITAGRHGGPTFVAANLVFFFPMGYSHSALEGVSKCKF